MIIIGADFHPGFQQIALLDTESGELRQRRLQHREEAEKFYRELAGRRCPGDPLQKTLNLEKFDAALAAWNWPQSGRRVST